MACAFQALSGPRRNSAARVPSTSLQAVMISSTPRAAEKRPWNRNLSRPLAKSAGRRGRPLSKLDPGLRVGHRMDVVEAIGAADRLRQHRIDAHDRVYSPDQKPLEHGEKRSVDPLAQSIGKGPEFVGVIGPRGQPIPVSPAPPPAMYRDRCNERRAAFPAYCRDIPRTTRWPERTRPSSTAG